MNAIAKSNWERIKKGCVVETIEQRSHRGKVIQRLLKLLAECPTESQKRTVQGIIEQAKRSSGAEIMTFAE